MVDNSLCTEPPLRWNPKDFPRSDLGKHSFELTKAQGDAATLMRRITRRQDIRYLETHPEIRAITTMLLNEIWTKRPKSGLASFCADFFSRPRDEIERELERFLPEEYKTKDEQTNADLVRLRKMEENLKLMQKRDQLELKPEHDRVQEEPSISTVKITISAVSAEKGVLEILKPSEQDVSLNSGPDSLGSYMFSNSVEIMLNELKDSMNRLRNQLGLEDIGEEDK